LAENFDYFIALDGFGLNGFEGFGGIARLRCNPAADQYDIKVNFYDGLAGGHATQINPQGTIGYLGNLSQTLLFYDPRTLKELKRFSTLRFYAPDVFYSSQTHVAWIDETHFITVLGPDLYLFDYHDLENPQRLGAHGVTLPHAMKKSKSGRYLFIGAMDHDKKGYANQLGIFDLETNEAKVVALPATAWHLGVHPTKDVCYAPTQRCTPQENMEFVEYTMAHFKNYLYEIDAESAQVTRHLTIPKDLPGFLTSDVVVTDTEVLYNCCASHVIAIADLETFSKVEYIDEIPSFWQQIWYWKAGLSNLLEAMSRVNLPGAVHTLFKSLRITRWTSIDGSFGLQLSPDKRYLISARRGMNMVVVYTYPERKLVKRIPFPSIRKFFPEHVGWFGDPRLGFHHTALCTTSVEENG
jgi:hypothetical protein